MNAYLRRTPIAAVLLFCFAATAAAQDEPRTFVETDRGGSRTELPVLPPRSLEQVLGIAPGQSPEALSAAAEAARRRGERFRAYALITLARRAADTGARPDEKMVRRLAERQRDWTEDLFPEEAACAAAWCGVTPDLSLHFARRSLDNRRAADAAAEALALIADPMATPKQRREALPIVDRAGGVRTGRGPRVAGGAHYSVYQVAALLPLTGDYAVYGRSILHGLQLALEDSVLAAGGLPVRLQPYDTAGDPSIAADRTREALLSGAGVLVGDALSVATYVIAGASQERGVVLMSPSATDERIGEAGPHVYQTGLARATQAWALAAHAADELEARRIAVAQGREPEAIEFAAAFRAAAESLGVETVSLASPAGRREIASAIDQLRRSDADALLLPSDAAAAELWLSGLGPSAPRVKLLASEALDVAALPAEARRRADELTVASLDYALPETVFTRVESRARDRFGAAADRLVRRGWLTGRALMRALRQRAASPLELATALAPRGPNAALVGDPNRRFLLFPESEASVPIQVWRRGSWIRVR